MGKSLFISLFLGELFEALSDQVCRPSDVFGEQKLGSGLGSAFRVRVRFGDQYFGDSPLRFQGFPGFLLKF